MKQNENKLCLAKRFIGALDSSDELCSLNIQEYNAQLNSIIGDILISSVFALYYGPFPKKYREGIKASFFKFLENNNNKPESETAKKPVSVKNATILSNLEKKIMRNEIIISLSTDAINWPKKLWESIKSPN